MTANKHQQEILTEITFAYVFYLFPCYVANVRRIGNDTYFFQSAYGEIKCIKITTDIDALKSKINFILLGLPYA